jgi:modulator of FtsH protease
VSYYQRESTLRDLVPGAATRPLSASMILGQVMFLVAVAIGFFAAGAYIGRDLSYGTAMFCEFGAIGILLAQSFGGQRLRTGSLGMSLLFGLGLLLGLGVGPVIAHYANSYNDSVLYRAAGGTALTVAGMGTWGYLTSRDLMRWARPLFFALFGVIAISWILLLVGSGANPVLQLAIYGLSAAYLAIYFQFMRRAAGADDVIWLATGVFITVVNIFLTLLSLMGNNR